LRVVAVPRAERSGSHRVVDVDVGDLRQAIATLAGVATLARAHAVGPRAIRDSLPELRATCLALPATATSALLPACDVVALSTGLADDARTALEALVSETREVAADVIEAIDMIERRGSGSASSVSGIGARGRLKLESSCQRAVERLARVLHAIELLQRASIGEPVHVAMDELFRELDTGDLAGRLVELGCEGALSTIVAIHPRVGVAVLVGALARLVQQSAGQTFVASVRTERGRAIVEFRKCEKQELPKSTVRVTVPEPASYDQRVLRLAAATLAAPLHEESGAVRLELLRV